MPIQCMIMSPFRHAGTTTVSMLLAQGVTYLNKTCTLITTDENARIATYAGLDEQASDITRSPSLMVQLIEAHAVENSELLRYALPIAKNAYYLSIQNASLQGMEKLNTIKHLFDKTATDIVVLDHVGDINDKDTKEYLGIADALFIVIDMSFHGIELLKEWLESNSLQDFPNTFVILNHYDEVVSSVRDYTKQLGIPASRVCKLHHNPWINKCINIKQLPTLYPLAYSFDPRVANIRNDIEDIARCLMSTDVVKMKKGQ